MIVSVNTKQIMAFLMACKTLPAATLGTGSGIVCFI